MTKLLFLDFDGVLNNFTVLDQSVTGDIPATPAEEATIEKLMTADNWKEQIPQFWLSTIRMLSPDMVGRLNQVIEATGAIVVVSSAWRNVFPLAVLRILLEHHGFQGTIVDKTPTKMSLHSRASEIRMWFSESKDGDTPIAFKDIERFVIIDDDTSPGYEDNWPDNFVNTDLDVGLDDAGMSRAIENTRKEIIMGCDIHMWVEVRDDVNSPWRLAKVPGYRCSWCAGKGKGHEDRECYGCKGTGLEHMYSDRNYNLFGMLADVRNGRGFAGVRTGDGYEPISEPRGWPDDLSDELKDHFSNYCVEGFCDEEVDYEARDAYDEMNYARTGAEKLRSPGEHSETWLRLDEVLEYFENGARKSKHQGWVTPGAYKHFKETGEPNSWCGGVSGPAIQHVSHEYMDSVIDNPEKFGVNLSDEFGGKYYTLVEWSSTYKEDAGKTFIEHFLPACQTLGEARNVRLVFNFDS